MEDKIYLNKLARIFIFANVSWTHGGRDSVKFGRAIRK